MLGLSHVLKPIKRQDLKPIKRQDLEKIAAMCFKQVQRFILTKKYLGVRGTLNIKSNFDLIQYFDL